MNNMINIDDFDKVEMRAGTVVDCKINKKAKLLLNFSLGYCTVLR